MADTENRDIDFNKARQGLQKAEAPKDGKGKKPHGKKSFAWWAGVIVLILISITFILPATGVTSLFMDTSIEFGRYNGTPIEYANGSYMFNQYYNLYMQYGSYMDSTSLLYQAYYNTVLHEALTQKAEEVGFYASEEMINHAIIDSGYYNNADGVFDEAAYNATGVSERTSIYNSARDLVPAQTVSADIATVLSSDAEREFISTMAATGRTFDYVAFDYTAYPADLAQAYANNNPQPFTVIQTSVLSAASQDEADSLLDELNADPALFDTRLSEAGSESQSLCFYELSAIGEENVNTLFSTAEGAFAGPFQNGSSWEIYRVDASPVVPDFTDSSILDKVRSYINTNDASLVTDWAAGASQDFYAAASADFDGAAAQAGLTAQTVDFTPVSNGHSGILSSFSATDAYGLLSAAASGDSAYNELLFTSAEGTVLEPAASGNAWIVTRVNAETVDSSQSSFIDTFYDYLNSSMASSDLQNAILTSSLFEDNFYTVVIEQLINSSN